jgi:putative ABC transport system substrate-binding protein
MGNAGRRCSQARDIDDPIVFVSVADPVGSGLVASQARPGGNLTGVTNIASDLSRKLVEILVEVIPGVNRIAVLRNPNNSTHSLLLRETEAGSRALGLTLQVVDVAVPEDLEGAFAQMTRASAQGMVALAEPLYLSERRRIAELALNAQLPTVFARRENVEAGGFMSYGASLRDQFRHAAVYVDKILKGTKPTDLPVEQPTKFELVINLKTAKTLGLEIPPTVLARADDVIE